MTCNNDFAVAWNTSDPADQEAANRQLAFQFGWFMDPVVFGYYPPEMVKYVSGNRLPSFTPEQVALVKGSFDYIGLNHYTSSYTRATDKPGNDWFTDTHNEQLKTNASGHYIGPLAQSTWLNVYPPGVRGVLNWVD
jgi:beta-glucosidase